MSPGLVRFVRGNAFLVAAGALPILVVGVFLLASAIPRWTVPPPGYDLVLRATGPHDQANPRAGVDFVARDGRVEATVRGLPATAYAQSVALFLFDHRTQEVRQVPFDLPEPPPEGAPPKTVTIEALAGRRVIAQAQAPDGYQLQSRDRRGPGLVGELFGMGRYHHQLSLVKDGRAVSIELPPPYEFRYHPEPYAVGWIVDEQP